MQTYLLFRLYGPLCSWGDIAVGEYRPGSSHPTRSGVLGLVAAALGLRRDDNRMTALFNSVRYAVRIDHPGVLLTDYHTSQVPSGGASKNIKTFSSRREELLSVSKHDLNTILSKRDYLCDAVFTVALWLEGEPSVWTLPDIAAALKQPVFPLYLGRKSCPPSLPLAPSLIEAATLREVLAAAYQPEEANSLLFGKDLLQQGATSKQNTVLQVFWEPTEHAGMPEQHSFTRRDDPGSRTRRQFAARQELHGTITIDTAREG